VPGKKELGQPGCTICCSRRCCKFWSSIRAVMLVKEGNKSDKVDARTLAELLRTECCDPSTTEKMDYGLCASWGELFRFWRVQLVDRGLQFS